MDTATGFQNGALNLDRDGLPRDTFIPEPKLKEFRAFLDQQNRIPNDD
jgi:hypothetical protein